MSAIYFGIDFGRITTGGIVTGFPLPNFFGSIYCITAGPDGNVWFTQPQANQIGRITPSGAVTEFLLPTRTGSPRGPTEISGSQNSMGIGLAGSQRAGGSRSSP